MIVYEVMELKKRKLKYAAIFGLCRFILLVILALSYCHFLGLIQWDVIHLSPVIFEPDIEYFDTIEESCDHLSAYIGKPVVASWKALNEAADEWNDENPDSDWPINVKRFEIIGNEEFGDWQRIISYQSIWEHKPKMTSTHGAWPFVLLPLYQWFMCTARNIHVFFRYNYGTKI